MSDSDGISKVMPQILSSGRTGDIEGFYSSIKEDPELLNKLEKLQFVNTPLHEAAATGNTTFAVEMMNLMPSLGKKLNPEGFTPLHLAVQENKVDTAKALVRIDKQLVRVKGKGGVTPLHHAAAEQLSRDFLAGFLYRCPDSIDDVTSRFQTAVHVALEHGNQEGFTLLLGWLRRRAKLGPVLELKDEDGNTAFHIAVKQGNVKAVKMLINIVRRNRRNSARQTALDVAESRGASLEMIHILTKAKIRRGVEMPRKRTMAEYLYSPVSTMEHVHRNYYYMLRELMTGEISGVILVVAVLIATATYQAVLQPPGGVNQGQSSSQGNNLNATTTSEGKMVLTKNDYVRFMPQNTVAFVLSIIMIIFVLHGKPYNVILHVCLIFMADSYLTAMEVISAYQDCTRIMVVVSWCLIALAVVIKAAYHWSRPLFKDMWWFPTGRAKTHNFITRYGGEFGVALRLKRQYKLLHD